MPSTAAIVYRGYRGDNGKKCKLLPHNKGFIGIITGYIGDTEGIMGSKTDTAKGNIGRMKENMGITNGLYRDDRY